MLLAHLQETSLGVVLMVHSVKESHMNHFGRSLRTVSIGLVFQVATRMISPVRIVRVTHWIAERLAICIFHIGQLM